MKAENCREERHRNKREGEIGERKGEGDERGRYSVIGCV